MGIRYRLLEVPLERDEGEYAYGGQLILQGLPLYQQLYSMKLPGVYAAYAGILTIFGQTARGIHFGLLIINAATIVLVFLLARRLVDGIGAAVASASFAVLSVGQAVQGVFANAEHFVILTAVGGGLLLLKALDEDRPLLLFLSGLLFGLSFLMKQPGAFFAAFGGFYLVIDLTLNHKAERVQLAYRFLLYVLGAAAPYGFTCLTFYLTGWFGKFWFLTYESAKIYSSKNTIAMAWVAFKRHAVPIARTTFPIWILAGTGLTALLWDRWLRKHSIFIAMFTVFSFLAICPAFYFRPHYFLMMLPSVALLCGVAVSALVNKRSLFSSQTAQSILPILVFVVCLLVSIYQQRNFLFQMTPTEACRAVFHENPFPESLEIATFVKARTQKDERIAVIGSEPQIYFYSDRLSASGYIYMYPMMRNHDFAFQMLREMIREIEAAKPKLLIFINNFFSWTEHSSLNVLLFKWFIAYQAKYYKAVGLVDISADKTRFYWGAELKGPPHSPLWIAVFERRT